jgi:hypothetical protein
MAMSRENPAENLIQVNVHLSPSEYTQVEDWRRVQPGIPSRASAVRGFMVKGMKVSSDVPAAKPSVKGQAA